MKISICNELFEGWDIAKVFDYAAQLGFDGVELAPFTLGETASDISAAERKRIRGAADKAGIEIVDTHHQMETNKKMRAVSEMMGGKVYKRHRIYQKHLQQML